MNHEIYTTKIKGQKVVVPAGAILAYLHYRKEEKKDKSSLTLLLQAQDSIGNYYKELELYKTDIEFHDFLEELEKIVTELYI